MLSRPHPASFCLTLPYPIPSATSDPPPAALLLNPSALNSGKPSERNLNQPLSPCTASRLVVDNIHCKF
ncbi:hypothetical protein E2C01_059379 [Portunus trituberculatus]|uniref:Uncharacterized protein n=1 Tax=Portunus trituberculatus TaxID=210409 RepID=A0A5B7H5N9_PORTR|nr:hypothetical protein [Portunus trituberculatus]